MRKKYFQVVTWVMTLSSTLVSPVRIPVVRQSIVEVVYIQLGIGGNRETGLAYYYYYYRFSSLTLMWITEALP